MAGTTLRYTVPVELTVTVDAEPGDERYDLLEEEAAERVRGVLATLRSDDDRVWLAAPGGDLPEPEEVAL